jgi:hypothetical protein
MNSDLRSIALLINRQGHLASREYFLGALQGEVTAREALGVRPRIADGRGRPAGTNSARLPGLSRVCRLVGPIRVGCRLRRRLPD